MVMYAFLAKFPSRAFNVLTVVIPISSRWVTPNLAPAFTSSQIFPMPKVTRGASRRSAQSHHPYDLKDEIVSGLQEKADNQTKEWFTNYVKGTTWIGCKLPVVRSVVKDIAKKHEPEGGKKRDVGHTMNFDVMLDNAVELLQLQECDAKLAGMLLLAEESPLVDVATQGVLQRLVKDVLLPGHIADWSTADWFAMKVLRRMVLAGDHDLALEVLDFSRNGRSLWHRRCGLIAFINYNKNRDKLPPDIGSKIVAAVERSLLASPDERFTQTGCAWVVRYMLLQEQEGEAALAMIERNGSLWNMEAKKSLVEKLDKKDPRRARILELGS